MIAELEKGPRGSLLASLAGDGFQVGEVGLDFSLLQSRRFDTAPGGMVNDSEVRQALHLLASHGRHNDFLTELIFRSDWSTRREPVCSFQGGSYPSGISSSLKHLGYAKIDDWGLDMASLQREASAALEGDPRGEENEALRLLKHVPLPSLGPLLHNASVAQGIERYFGGKARYDGHVVLQLKPAATESTYKSFQWHHDRCGRRLKLWIYLHDVYGFDNHPTLVARCTHLNFYYSY